jgi:WD40 repeat protein
VPGDYPDLLPPALFSEQSIVGFANAIWSAIWSPDGSEVVTAEDWGTVRVWQIANQPATFIGCCENQGWPAESVEFSASADRILVVYGEFPFGTARIWERAEDGEWVVSHVFDAGNIEVATMSLDGEVVLTADRDLKTAQLWDGNTFEPLMEIDTGLIVGADISPSGGVAATAGTDRTVRIWDLRTGALLHELRTLAGVTAVAFSPDGRWVVAGGSDGTTRVWDASSGRVLAVLQMHADAVNAIDVSDDGRIVSASDDQTAKIYSCSTCVSNKELFEMAREHAAIGT